MLSGFLLIPKIVLPASALGPLSPAVIRDLVWDAGQTPLSYS